MRLALSKKMSAYQCCILCIKLQLRCTCKTQVRRSHVFFFPILAACSFQASQIQNKTHPKIGCFPFENCQWQLEHHFPDVHSNFPSFLTRNLRFILFFSRKFRNYRNCVVCFTEIQQFPDFLKSFPTKFSYHLPRFRNFRNFWWQRHYQWVIFSFYGLQKRLKT